MNKTLPDIFVISGIILGNLSHFLWNQTLQTKHSIIYNPGSLSVSLSKNRA